MVGALLAADRAAFNSRLAPLAFLLKREANKRTWSNEASRHLVQLRDLREVGLLGTGGFGRVALVKHVDEGVVYALKSLDKSRAVRMLQVEQVMSERVTPVTPFIPVTSVTSVTPVTSLTYVTSVTHRSCRSGRFCCSVRTRSSSSSSPNSRHVPHVTRATSVSRVPHVTHVTHGTYPTHVTQDMVVAKLQDRVMVHLLTDVALGGDLFSLIEAFSRGMPEERVLL